MQVDAQRTLPEAGDGLALLWLEIGSRCNMNCIHCYADSSPHAAEDRLASTDYMRLLNEAAALGCRNVQFIGGEPTLNRDLRQFLAEATRLGFRHIEVYTNLLSLPQDLLGSLVANKIGVATSFYAADPSVHDAITRRPGSHAATVRNITRTIAAGLRLRVGIISMDQNASMVEETRAFLQALGVTEVGVDRVRAFGRGADLLGDGQRPKAALSELCGSCWKGSLSVAADGTVSACIMSKSWPVGTVPEMNLQDIVASDALRAIRRQVYTDVWTRRRGENGVSAACNPGPCSPDCSPACSPCYPHGKCDPELFCGPCGPGR